MYLKLLLSWRNFVCFYEVDAMLMKLVVCWWSSYYIDEVPTMLMKLLLFWWSCCYINEVPNMLMKFLLCWWSFCYVMKFLLCWWSSCYVNKVAALSTERQMGGEIHYEHEHHDNIKYRLQIVTWNEWINEENTRNNKTDIRSSGRKVEMFVIIIV